MDFFLLSIKTRSGLSAVVRTSGGIVTPFIFMPGRSAYIIYLLPIFSSIRALAKWLRTKLCLQVKRPCSRKILHQLNVCSKFPKFPHWSHFFVFFLPHLFQLLGVFNPLTLFFIANDRTPRRMLLTTLFQVIFSFSSTKAL